MNMNREAMDEQMEGSMPGSMSGGRRHMGSKKRHGNASLRAWVTFVKKVQREEGVGYKEAMTLAKKRKDKGEKWRGGGDDDAEKSDVGKSAAEDTVVIPDVTREAAAVPLPEDSIVINDSNNPKTEIFEGEEYKEGEFMGGRRRRRRGTKKRRGSKKRRGTKKRRGSRRRRH